MTVFSLFAKLDAFLQHLGQGVAHSGLHVVDTSDASEEKTEASHPRRRMRSKRTFKMKKVWGPDEVSRFLVTGATDAAGKPSHFFFASAAKTFGC